MTLLQNNFTNNQNVQTITQTLKNTFHHLKYGPDFKKYDNTMQYPLFFRTNNERLNDKPIYIKIKRNFNDEYATLTFKMLKKLKMVIINMKYIKPIVVRNCYLISLIV